MANKKITRPDLGAGSRRILTNKDFTNEVYEDIQGKGVTYNGCDFSYSILIRGYFHKAHFKNCKFVGTRFSASIFRSASFENCNFSYADFNRCVVPIPQMLANLPMHPNVRWELLYNLRANTKSVGDTQHESKIIWNEIETEIEYWRLISKSRAGYYQKYSTTQRFFARLQHWRLLFERYLWGHGESLSRLGIATFLSLVFVALLNAIGQVDDLGAESLHSFLTLWFKSLTFIVSLYIDLPSVNPKDVESSLITSSLAVILRYISIGLAVPVLYKYIAKR